MKQEELNKILESHNRWLNDNRTGECADLSGAELSGVNLSDADLNGASFKNAYLSDVTGNMKELRSMQIETYTIAYTNTIMQIGCENHLINDWFKFDDGRILKMDGKKALKFWRKWKPILKLIIEDK